jgi:hypothetical protein
MPQFIDSEYYYGKRYKWISATKNGEGPAARNKQPAASDQWPETFKELN